MVESLSIPVGERVTRGVIKRMFEEKKIDTDIIVQLGDPEFEKDKYRGPINDKEWFTDRCSFSPGLSAFVSKNLTSGDIIKILKFSLTKRGYLVLEEVCKLGSVEDPLGDPESIDDIIEKSKKKQKNPTTPALTRSRKCNNINK